MTVALISRSEALHAACKDILADLGRPELVTVGPRDPIPSADFFLWDYCPEGNFSLIKPEKPDHHLVLVDTENLSSAANYLVGGMVLLVKPVDKPALAQWLSRMIGSGCSMPPAPHHVCREAEDGDWCDFVAKGLHDFGAPLTAASGYCGLLLGEEFGALSARQKDILGRMRNSLARLGRLTSEIFEKTASARRLAKRPPAGTANYCLAAAPCISPIPEPEACDIEQCVKQAIHEVELFATGKRLRVISKIAPVDGAIHFDPSHLEQVLSNLLDNACKFTPNGGLIEIYGYPASSDWRGPFSNGSSSPSINFDGNSFQIDVFNTGPTIALERLERIFDDYASFAMNAGENQPIRTPERGSSGRTGAGLGLAICKRIVERYQGKIWAENRPTGPVISFLLPLRGNAEVLMMNGAQNRVRQPYSEQWPSRQLHAG